MGLQWTLTAFQNLSWHHYTVHSDTSCTFDEGSKVSYSIWRLKRRTA